VRYLHKSITAKLIILFFLGIIFMNFCYAQEAKNPGKGYLDIGLNVSTDIIYVVVNDDWENYKSVNMEEPLELPQGRQKVTVIAKGLQDATFYTDISAGKVTRKNITMANAYIDGTGSSYQWIKNGVNYSIITDDDSEIFVDGKWVALGSFEVQIPLGKHKIEIVHPSGAKKEKELNINSYRFTLIEMYNKPIEWRAKLFGFTPGGSQFYKNQNIKGYCFFGLPIICVSLAGIYEISYRHSNEQYEDYKKTYYCISEITPQEEISKLAKGAEEHYKIAKNDAEMRDIFLYSAIGIYAINIIDALFWPPKAGYRKKFNDTKRNMSIKLNKNMLALNYSITF
jgi:hypothetical protein